MDKISEAIAVIAPKLENVSNNIDKILRSKKVSKKYKDALITEFQNLTKKLSELLIQGTDSTGNQTQPNLLNIVPRSIVERNIYGTELAIKTVFDVYTPDGKTEELPFGIMLITNYDITSKYL